MLRYACDLCGRDVADARYVVKIEIYAAHDPAQLTEDDLDDDPIEALGEELREAGDDADLAGHLPPTRSALRYDLCPACHKKYLRNPLSRDADKTFHFSEN